MIAPQKQIDRPNADTLSLGGRAFNLTFGERAIFTFFSGIGFLLTCRHCDREGSSIADRTRGERCALCRLNWCDHCNRCGCLGGFRNEN